MKLTKLTKTLAAGLVGLITLIAMQSSMAAELAGVEIEERVFIEGYERPLLLSGTSQVSRNFMPFHVLALHVPVSLPDAPELLEGLSPFRLELVWLAHHLDATRTRQFWQQSFAASISNEDTLRRMRGRIEQFDEMLGEAQRGQRWVFEYHPDSGLLIQVDGERRGQIAGVEFLRALAGQWLGESASDQLKAELLARVRKQNAVPQQ